MTKKKNFTSYLKHLNINDLLKNNHINIPQLKQLVVHLVVYDVMEMIRFKKNMSFSITRVLTIEI